MSHATGLPHFRPVADGEADRLATTMLPWLYEAGNPFYDWFFGGTEEGQKIVHEWMLRPSSEVSLSRLELLVDDEPVGGFVALSGQDLLGCRRADALALMTRAGRASWSRLEEKAVIGRELFPPVESDEYYLSKMGVVPERRGQGHGATIVRRYVDSGLEQGLRRLRLDVSTENRTAIRLYESFGFEILAESSSERAGMRYLAMARDLGS
jgi:ribosomal protein S18 acetylase RimI-like enzyme